jgi:AraC-like DNA-binding protein
MHKELSFLFHDDVQQIFNNFTSLFSIRISFFTPDGSELKVGNNMSICSYCTAIKQSPGGAQTCFEQDRNARREAYNKQALVAYTCHGGMTEAVKPIIQDSILIGYAMIGQIRTKSLPPSHWCQVWETQSDEPLRELYERQQLRSPSELKAILQLFDNLMDLITAKKMIKHTGIDKLTGLVGYLKTHPELCVSLSEAADFACLSKSRLSHLIKERYGLSYYALVRQIKMEHARFLLSHYLTMNIDEVAQAIGMDDAQYFSRIFKKEHDVSPSQYRKRQDSPQT